jgi:hypothetical protein
MALTLVDSPDTHTPCYNPQGFIFSSTNTAQANFTYHFILTINGVVITRDIDANPIDNLFYFDAQKNAESHCKNEFWPTILDFQFSLDGAIRQIDWSIQEKYGTPPALQGAATTGTYYVWNAAYKTIDFPSYAFGTTTIAKDLTLVPSNIDTIHFDQKYLYKTWHRGFSTRNIRYLSVTAFDSAGATLQTTIIENAWYTPVTGANYVKNYIIANVSPYGLNNFWGAAIISKSAPLLDVIPANTAQYSMYFYETTPLTVASSLYTVNIDSFCSRYDRYVLHFLNKLGNYDSFTFNMLNRETSENKQSEYKKFAARKIGSSYTYYPYDSETVNYSTVITRRILLNSDIITDAQMNWLDELLHSPSIYLETPDDTTVVGDQRALYAVKLTNRGPFERKKKVNDKIFNLTLEVQYSFEDIRQRG